MTDPLCAEDPSSKQNFAFCASFCLNLFGGNLSAGLDWRGIFSVGATGLVDKALQPKNEEEKPKPYRFRDNRHKDLTNEL
jgi:hypothetical protein